MTRREFEKSQQEKILVQSFKRQQFKDVAPATDSEIKERYQKRSSDLRDRSKDVITFRKIYIPSIDQDNPVATQEDQLALAEKLAAEVKGGADFSSVAKSHSAGAFADKGGLWEDTLRSDLEVGFADIVFDSPEGTIVGPIKDRVGFTIVQVVKISTGPLPPFDAEMRERMRSEVEIEKRSGRYDEWIKMLKRNAIIRRNT
jgi:peptidyl-prolyl cis-trans isomerase SurA